MNNNCKFCYDTFAQCRCDINIFNEYLKYDYINFHRKENQENNSAEY